MSNPWFRLYSEFATDPKVQRLSETDQRRFIMILCLRCSNGVETLQDEDVTFQLRITAEEWLITKQVLLSKCLITADNKPTAWNKRQFASDSSTPRVKEHRELKKQQCNVSETAPDTDTDTDKPSCALQAKRDLSMQSFPKFWESYPKKKNKGDAEKAWKSIKPSANMLTEILEAVEVAKQSDDWRKNGGTYIPYPASWLRAKGWMDSAPTKEATASVYVMPDIFRGAL